MFGSVPTVILLALLYALYTAIVHKPLQRVLAERRSKTEGAVKICADIAAAEARTAEYEQKYARRGPRSSGRRKPGGRAVLQARTNALNEARAATAQVLAAKKDIEHDRAAGGLPADAAALAQEISGACCSRRERAVTSSTTISTTRGGRAGAATGELRDPDDGAQERHASSEQKQASQSSAEQPAGTWQAAGARQQGSRPEKRRTRWRSYENNPPRCRWSTVD